MIFNEIYSAYYNAVAKIISAIISGNADEKSLNKIVEENAFGESMFSILPSLKSEKWQLVNADLNEDYTVDSGCVSDLITENTVAIVGIAGTTELGMIDPIGELSDIALENDIHLHVDAAFGGFSIPFLKEEGYDFPDFDFSLKGVRSITVDPHKMGLAPIPAGGILFKDEIYLKAMNVDSPYLTVKQQSTIVGTRLGATAAATYAVMKHLGREGYRNNAKEALDNAFFLARELENLGYELVVEPKLNIVAFNHPQIKTEELASLLEEKDWKVSCSHCPKAIRIILMNHIKRHHLIELLKDLKEISESV